jgi:hypothetical protein
VTTTQITIEVPERISLNLGTGQSDGLIPWTAWHKLELKLSSLEIQSLLCELVFLMSRVPELYAVRISADPDYEGDDQGGTFKVFSRPFSFTLASPIDRIVTLREQPNGEVGTLDFTGVGNDEDAFQDLVNEYFEDFGSWTDPLSALDDQGVSKAVLKRSDIIDLLELPEVDLEEVAKRLVRY